MQVGNARYRKISDFPAAMPLFPLAGALLLPGHRMPLNIFEPRYLQMVDTIVGTHRLIGMIQPELHGRLRPDGEPELCQVGCIGRLTSLTETGDGRYVVALEGVCRFRLREELEAHTPFRQSKFAPLLADLEEDPSATQVNRPALLQTLRDYLDANELQADWDGINRADNATLVNSLSMMAPFGPAEKQALLEAGDLRVRADTLIAMTEMVLARDGVGSAGSLQ